MSKLWTLISALLANLIAAYAQDGDACTPLLTAIGVNMAISLEFAGLLDYVTELTKGTLLVPSDEAFSKLFTEDFPIQTLLTYEYGEAGWEKELQQVLKLHYLPDVSLYPLLEVGEDGAVLQTALMANETTFCEAHGQPTNLNYLRTHAHPEENYFEFLSSGGFGEVVEADIMTCEGVVIHVIDDVLYPCIHADEDLPTPPKDCTQLKHALHQTGEAFLEAAGLLETVLSFSSGTLFLPVPSALEEFLEQVGINLRDLDDQQKLQLKEVALLHYSETPVWTGILKGGEAVLSLLPSDSNTLCPKQYTNWINLWADAKDKDMNKLWAYAYDGGPMNKRDIITCEGVIVHTINGVLTPCCTAPDPKDCE